MGGAPGPLRMGRWIESSRKDNSAHATPAHAAVTGPLVCAEGTSCDDGWPDVFVTSTISVAGPITVSRGPDHSELCERGHLDSTWRGCVGKRVEIWLWGFIWLWGLVIG
jgi:hypothetical protein